MFEEFSLKNYLEVVSYFLAIITLTCFGPLLPVQIVLLSFAIILVFIVSSMNYSERSKNIEKLKRGLYYKLKAEIGRINAKTERESIFGG